MKNKPSMFLLFSNFHSFLKPYKFLLIRGFLILGIAVGTAVTVFVLWEKVSTDKNSISSANEEHSRYTQAPPTLENLRDTMRDLSRLMTVQMAYLCLRQDILAGLPLAPSLNLLMPTLQNINLPKEAHEALTILKRLGEGESVWNLSQIQTVFKETFARLWAKEPESKGFWSFLGSFATLKNNRDERPSNEEKFKNFMMLLQKGHVNEVYAALQKMETPKDIAAQKCLKQMHRFLAAQKALRLLDQFLKSPPLEGASAFEAEMS